jgi:hypothetical protein
MSWRLQFHGHVEELESALNQQVEAQKEGRKEIELRHLGAVVDSIKKVADERSAGSQTITVEASGHADDSYTNVTLSLTVNKVAFFSRRRRAAKEAADATAVKTAPIVNDIAPVLETEKEKELDKYVEGSTAIKKTPKRK